MKRHGHAGFTLIELLVAITIFAVLAAMAYGGLRSVLKAEHAIAAHGARLQALQQTMLFLTRDLSQLAGRGIRDEYGDRQPPLRTQSNTLARLELTRGGWSNPAGQLRSTLQRIGYGLEGRQLVRYSWRVLDRAPDTQPQRLPLLEGVSEWQWRFMDDQGQWHEEWPLPGSGQRPSSALPRAVELTLMVEELGQLRRLWAIDAHEAVAGTGP